MVLELPNKNKKQSQKGRETKKVSVQKKRNTQTKDAGVKRLTKAKKEILKSENGYLQTDASNFNSYEEDNEALVSQRSTIKKLNTKIKQHKNEKDKRNKKSPIKLKLPRVPPPPIDDLNASLQHNLMNSPPPTSHSAQILLQDGMPLQSLLPQTPLPLSAISSPSPSNYDLTDRDSVRQLLSSRG